MELRSLISLRIAFVSFTLIFIFGLAEGVLLASPDEPTAKVGQVAIFLAALLPGVVIGLLARSGRRALFNAMIAGLPALIVILLLANSDHTLTFYPSSWEIQASLFDQFIFRVLMFSLLLVISTVVGRYVGGEKVAGPEIFAVREIGPKEEMEEVEKKIEEQVLKEKLSGISLLEEAVERKEGESSTEKGVEAPTPDEGSVKTRLCLFCGTVTPSTAKFCSSCGRELE
ncbi:MAG: hypothetical protein ACETV0_00645 [Nitrososphaeria archaeon]